MGKFPKKIVVIGSNSFSGSSFVVYCLSLGIEVLGMSGPRPFVGVQY